MLLHLPGEGAPCGEIHAPHAEGRLGIRVDELAELAPERLERVPLTTPEPDESAGAERVRPRVHALPLGDLAETCRELVRPREQTGVERDRRTPCQRLGLIERSALGASRRIDSRSRSSKTHSASLGPTASHQWCASASTSSGSMPSLA